MDTTKHRKTILELIAAKAEHIDQQREEENSDKFGGLSEQEEQESPGIILLNSKMVKQVSQFTHNEPVENPRGKTYFEIKAREVEEDYICDILNTAGPQRNKDMLNRLHEFFKQQEHTKLFVDKIFEQRGEYELFKIYQSLSLYSYVYNTTVNQVGDLADTLYFILKGQVGVLTPREHKQIFSNYFELLKFMDREGKFLVNMHDSHSNIVKEFIQTIG